MTAVYFALTSITLPPLNTIMLYSDSQAVVGVLKKGGSSTAFLLNSWMMTISKILVKNQWTIVPVHISGSLNCKADALSREGPIQTEWTLNRDTFLSRFPGLQIDLFATPQNAQLPKFVSPMPDHRAVACNALLLDWNQWEQIYLFPPVNLLLKVLMKLKEFKGIAILIAPEWQNSKWFPLLNSMSEKIYLPDCSLHQTSSNQKFYVKSYLTRHAWIF